MIKTIMLKLAKTVKDLQIALYFWIFVFVYGLATVHQIDHLYPDNFVLYIINMMVAGMVINISIAVTVVFLLVFIYNLIRTEHD